MCENELPYLNLGCGQTFHKDWTNINFVSSSKYVMAHNLLAGIPFPDNTFQVVYHSHVLEHFPKKKGIDFIKECYRVLKHRGIIRIAVPDLESIVLNYISYLKQSIDGVEGAAQKYEWTMLELFDQIVRLHSGGDMVEYIKNTDNNNDAFLLERNGYEVKRIMDSVRNPNPVVSSNVFSIFSKMNIVNKIKEKIKGTTFLLLLGKKEHAMYKSAKFRAGGEIHQWMYDRYSLKKLLEQVGFKEVQVKIAFESNIPEWEKYNLDGEGGILRKPDSLFIEAVKE